MPTLEEFAGKAALKNKTTSFETQGIPYRLVRIDDRVYYRAHEAGVSIQEDQWGLSGIVYADQRHVLAVWGLSEIYAALSVLVVKMLPIKTNIYEHIYDLGRRDINDNQRGKVNQEKKSGLTQRNQLALFC